MKRIEKKKVSIIVPCFKAEKYLPRCLESLVNQTLQEIEIICVNDGSPDKCIEIIKEYKRKFNDKIVIIDKVNEGVWKARKDGIEIAAGEYIGFVDADDYVAANFAEKLYTEAKSKNADIVVCGFDRIDMDTGKLYSQEMCIRNKQVTNIRKNPECILALNTALWNKFYKAQLLKKVKDLQNPPKILEDMMFLMLVYVNAKKVAFVSESLVSYMVHLDSTINMIKKEQIESTYLSICELRDIYENSNKEFLEVLDAMAFLHLGVSLMFRLSYDAECNLKETIYNNLSFLNEHFPTWKKSKYMKLSYIINKEFGNYKLYIVRWFYRLHLFRVFIYLYRIMIDRFKIDVKW